MIKKFLNYFIVLTIAMTFHSCASDADVNESMDGLKKTYEEYFAVIRENKDDPEKALEAGKKFIEDNRSKLKSYSEQMAGIASEEAMGKVQQTMKEIEEMSRAAGQELAPAFASSREYVQALAEQIEQLGMIAAEGEAGESLDEGNEDVRAAQREMILDNLDAEMMSSMPEEGREAFLTTTADGLAGASDEEKEAFKAEIKDKLGW